MRALLALLAAFPCMAQTGLSMENYQFVSSTRVSRTLLDIAYEADIVNTSGVALSSISAVATSTSDGVQIIQGGLQFATVPANDRVTSTGTFLIRIDRTAPFDFNGLHWAFSVNHPPTARPGPSPIVQPGSIVRLDGSRSFDEDGDPIIFTWAFISKPTGSTATLDDPHSPMPTFTTDKLGTFVLGLIVNDGKVNSAQATVTVLSFGPPPFANAGPSQTVSVGSIVHLDGTRSLSVDTSPLSYQWSLAVRPIGSAAYLQDSTSATPAFVADLPGVYTILLIVADRFASSGPDIVNITALQ